MSRRPVSVALALGSLVLFPAVAWADHQRTGFERRGGSGWTTLSEEQTYLRSVDDPYSNVRIAQVGTSVQGRPIQLVTIGSPLKSEAEIAAGPALLLVCSQHGDEPAGREACLQEIRHEAARKLPRTLLVIPTANPDGISAGTRTNAGGTDLNRDHVNVNLAQGTSPEARAIDAVVATLKPDITGDHHEYSNAHRVNGERTEHAYATVPEVSAPIRALSRQLAYDYVEVALEGAGFVVGAYGTTGTRSTLLNSAAWQRSVTVLVESPRQGLYSPTKRVAAHRNAIVGQQRMLGERASELAAATR